MWGWGGGGSFLPSFLQREGCLIQAQARTVVKSRKKTSDSKMTSSSIVPARTADKKDGTKGQAGRASPRRQPLPSFGAMSLGLGLRLVLGDSALSGGVWTSRSQWVRDLGKLASKAGGRWKAAGRGGGAWAYGESPISVTWLSYRGTTGPLVLCACENFRE